MITKYDFIIIGAGPAGMSAGIEAARHGLSVLVLGEQPQPGGQMYRSVERTLPRTMKILGYSYGQGKSMSRDFRSSPAVYVPQATVWNLEPDGTVSYISRQKAYQVRGRRVLIACGAKERPMPIPGWTLPGVMAATAADVLLKSHGVIPYSGIVLAGSGPLLFLSASRLIRAGADIKAVLDTTPPANLAGALPYLPKAGLGIHYLIKGLGFIWDIRRKSIPIFRGVDRLEAVGSDSVQAVRFTGGGAPREIEAETLLLHNGVVPDTQLGFLLQLEYGWDEVQRYWKPVTDAWGNTSRQGISVAGDAAGISGGVAAAAAGRLAALAAACALGNISRRTRDREASPLRRRLIVEKSVRPFLDRLFKPNPLFLFPQDDETLVCRCEEISAGQIREALKLGALGPNQLKTQTRAGMGPCQGRMCGLIISEMIAAHLNTRVDQAGYMRIRPPLKPVSLQQIADMELADDPDIPPAEPAG